MVFFISRAIVYMLVFARIIMFFLNQLIAARKFDRFRDLDLNIYKHNSYHGSNAKNNNIYIYLSDISEISDKVSSSSSESHSSKS